MNRQCFPFAAVIGQEDAKNALLLNVINPHIGGVLMSGEKGTAKSTLVRGLSDITKKMEVIELPLNITEDRLAGSIDIEAAITQGKAVLEPGLLYKADGNILYIDEVNLLGEHITDCLVEAAASGMNIIEREGLSYRHKSNFILVGTMNPEEGLLRPQIIDKFGLYIEIHGESDIDKRSEIIRRRLDFETDPIKFRNRWQDENRKLSEQISLAGKLLPDVTVTKDNLLFAAELVNETGCAGNRAEIVIIETAMAIAAFNGRTEITGEDIQTAAKYALPHRAGEKDTVPPESPSEPRKTQEERSEPQQELIEGQNRNESPTEPDNSEPENIPHGHNDDNATGNKDEDKIEEPDGDFSIEISSPRLNPANKTQGTGKRTKSKTDKKQGRYIKYSLPNGKAEDIAFDATLRAAAPFQRKRKREIPEQAPALIIKHQDLREKIKEKHTGGTILFIVDASSSMGAMRRMGAVKGAVLSMLSDAYQKRDRVGVVAFRKEGAETLLGITRSVDLAYKCLKELPTGGKTPMAAGLVRGYDLLKTAAIKEPDMLPYIVLVSDGRTNVSLMGGEPLDDVFKAAARIKNEGIRSIVLDTETGYIRLGIAKRIAAVMDAEYIRMENINARDIKSTVSRMVK